MAEGARRSLRLLAALVLAAGVLAACSVSEHEETESVRSVDRSGADAGVRPTDAGLADAILDIDATTTVDALDYYCNVPEPGPCCCEPWVLELRPPQDRATFSCDIILERPAGRPPIDANRINIMAEAEAGEVFVPRVLECSENEPGWELIPEEPPIARLCPVACEAIFAGEYSAIKVLQGCYSIYCPPP